MSKKIVVVQKFLDQDLIGKIFEKGKNLGYQVEYYNNVEEALPACADAEIIYGSHPALPKAAPALRWYNAFRTGKTCRPPCGSEIRLLILYHNPMNF